MLDIGAAWFSGIGQVVVGVAVACIAWQQHKTAKDKVRLDLFEKRFAVYRALIDKVRDPDAESEYGKQIHDTYWEKLQQARFLFGDDVNNYLQEVWGKSIKLSAISRSAPEKEPEHLQWVNAVTELRGWFYPQIDSEAVIELFSPYLNFERVLT